MSYTYYANGWLATIFEQYGTARGGGRPDPEPEAIDPLAGGGHWYGTEFIYDNRARLIRETRHAAYLTGLIGSVIRARVEWISQATGAAQPRCICGSQAKGRTNPGCAVSRLNRG